MIRGTALFLTVLTGFSGLVYEVTWQKYLATLLGSHSEATAAVLGIFLGGLSVGYWLFGRVTRGVVARAESAGRPPRLLLVYGLLEGGIGVWVVVFPLLFRAVRALSFSIPHGTGGMGFAVDVVLAALLIAPPSILMGGTIPMLTQALSRSLEDATRFHAFVYAFNTAGAFAGALAAGFWLIPRLGLVTVMLAMGAVNLLAGALFVALGLRGRDVVSLAVGDDQDSPARVEGFAWYAIVALLTGFAMMAVQTGLIRIAGLSFGSSQFTFSMVVAVFVLCIALGSFVVSVLPRIPRWLVVANQWGLGLLLLLLYLELPDAPYWVHALRTIHRDIDPAFYVYYGLGFVLVLLAIGPPVLLSGAALPLLFHHLRRQVGHLGDLAGTLYSWNTVGSLAGALLGGYALLFWLDLHHVYRLAVAAVLVSAAMLTVRVYSLRSHLFLTVVPLVALLGLLPGWAPEKLSVGLFRQREPLPGTFEGPGAFRRKNPGLYERPILFYDDDPTTSVAVREQRSPDGRVSRVILVNGKPDADTIIDYQTMGLVAVVSAMLADEPRRAFVIGWGAGITVGELASFDEVREIVVAEFSRGVIEAAPLFDEMVLHASRSPKVRIVESDAFRALMRDDETYDVIISEPSNAWVTGVEMLFSREFLAAARDRLSPGGVYCQWIHQYETDDASVELVLRTYTQVFEHVVVWAASSADLMLLGFEDPGPALDHFRLAERARRPEYAASLRRAGVDGFASLLGHEILPLGVAHALESEGPIHTLYHPILADMAGRAFFREDRALPPFSGFGRPAEIGAANSLLGAYIRLFRDGLPDEDRKALVHQVCTVQGPHCKTPLARWLVEEPESPVLREVLDDVVARTAMTSSRPVEEVAELLPAAPRPADPTTLERAERASADFQRSYLHGIPFDGDRLLEIWSSCRDSAADRNACVSAARQRILIDPEADERALIEECLARGSAGPACRAGLQAARQLVEEGVVTEPARPRRRPGERRPQH